MRADGSSTNLGDLLRSKLDNRIQYSVKVVRVITDEELASFFKDFLEVCKDNSTPPKIWAINRIREFTGCSLSEAKIFVDSWFDSLQKCMIREHQIIEGIGGSER